MDLFVDSAPSRNDRAALRARFRDDGCVFFSGLLDRTRVLALREDILRTIEKVGWTEPGSDALDAKPSPTSIQEGREGWWDGYIPIQSLESFHAFAHQDALLAMLRTLVADDVVAHPRRIARVIWPERPDITTPPHQDYTHIQGTTDCFTCWIPLSDCPPEMGGLRILRGSQTGGIRQLHRASGAGGVGCDVDETDPAWATADYKAGDVICFHSMVVHAGLPNTSEKLRLSVDDRFQSASDPITQASLVPHMHPRVPGWDVLTKGWSTTKWIDYPKTMTVSEFRMPSAVDTWHTELEPTPSRFARIG